MRQSEESMITSNRKVADDVYLWQPAQSRGLKEC